LNEQILDWIKRPNYFVVVFKHEDISRILDRGGKLFRSIVYTVWSHVWNFIEHMQEKFKR
jgi:hypothetical protein